MVTNDLGVYNYENTAVRYDIYASRGNANYSGGEQPAIVWNLGEINPGDVITMKFRIDIQDYYYANFQLLNQFLDEGGRLFTTTGTDEGPRFVYNENGEQGSAEFDVPQADVSGGFVLKHHYLVNSEGQPIDENGNVVAAPEFAAMVAEPKYYTIDGRTSLYFTDNSWSPYPYYNVETTDEVAGYGWCGKGFAMRAKGMGAVVVVTEIDPIKALEATMDGFTVLPMREAAKVGDLFVTLTGCRDVLTREHFEVMKDGALLANSGHFDVEINKEDLAAPATEIRERKPNIRGYRMADGRMLNLLADGRLVNLAAGNGHPAEIMDMSFGIQAKSLEYLAKTRGTLENKVYAVPAEIDKAVATIKLAAESVQIDVLTPEQTAYLNQIE